ncbi:MAG: O-antigen polysaccharide polymerase Wzy [Terriglobales bacterium]
MAQQMPSIGVPPNGLPLARARQLAFIPQVLFPPFAVATLLWVTSPFQQTGVHLATTFALLLMPWLAYQKWTRGEKRVFPLFVLVGGMMCLAFVPPLYWGEWQLGTSLGLRVFRAESLEMPLLLATCGVACLWAGMSLGLGRRLRLPFGVGVARSAFARNYLRVILVIGMATNAFSQFVLGEGGRQIVVIFQTVIPVAAFALLYHRYLRGEADRPDKLLLAGFVLVKFVVGLSVGWLGAAAGFMIVVLAVYLYERHKMPTRVVLIVLLLIFFLQPAKNEFRRTFWYGHSDAGVLARADFWLTKAAHTWGKAIEDPAETRELLQSIVHRLSLLEQSANVMELTPSIVPYQRGALYSYLAVTLIPRFLWPDKPSMNDANRWYQVSYGINPKGQLHKVSMAVGTITESYISFGWLGPVLIILPLGILLDFIVYSFLHQDSGLMLNAIGIALVPHLITVESQMAQYLAGLIQATVMAVLIFLPATVRLSRRRSQPSPLFTPASAESRFSTG